jgi:hypothetical protein
LCLVSLRIPSSSRSLDHDPHRTIYYLGYPLGRFAGLKHRHGPETWHVVGAGAPIGAAEPSPGQLRLALASCGRLWCGRAWLCAAGPGQVQSCLAHVARWFQFLPKCVPAYEIHNTTCGPLLVLKMCMKLAIYSSRT